MAWKNQSNQFASGYGVPQNTILERLSNMVVEALAYAANRVQSRPDGSYGKPALTTMFQAPTQLKDPRRIPVPGQPSPIDFATGHYGAGRYYGALPSQGDWFAAPPNPPASQSWNGGA